MAKIEKLQEPENTLPGDRLINNDLRPSVDVNVATSVVWEGEVDPSDSWDRPDTQSQLENVTVKISDGVSYGSFPVRREVKSGDTVWVVLVHYSTGDTFGNDSGQVSAAGVAVDEEEAALLESALRERSTQGYGWGDHANDVVVDGWSYYMGSWLGYFEHIEMIETRSVLVRG